MGALVAVCATVVCALVLLVAVVLTRRVVLCRELGSFDCSVRRTDARRGWTLGLGRYRDDRVDWFRIFSASPAPSLRWSRRSFEIDGWRMPTETEALTLLPGSVVVEVRCGGHSYELAVTPEVQSGLCSWLESAPPGQVRTSL